MKMMALRLRGGERQEMFSERGLMMIAVEDFQIKVFLSVCQSVHCLFFFTQFRSLFSKWSFHKVYLEASLLVHTETN